MVYDMFDFLDDSEQFPTSGHFSNDDYPQIWRGSFSSGEPTYDSYTGYDNDDYDYSEDRW